MKGHFLKRLGVVKGGALLFAVLRLSAWLGLAAGAVLAFLYAWWFSDFQGFSPDGPPPGFVRIPTPIFALLSFIPMLLMLSAHFPWISVPIVAGVLVDLGWRFLLTDANRSVANAWLARHALLFILGAALVATAYGGAAAYAHRKGPAELAVYNASGKVLENVVFECESGSVPIGRMLPVERRFLQIQPRAPQEKVHLRFQVEGSDHVAEFTGGIDNSRNYFFQFGIGEDLRGQFGAWEKRFRCRVTVTNDSGRPLRNVCVHGLGWQMRSDALEHGQSASEWVTSRGPMTFAISFEADGVRQAQELWRGWGNEGRPVTIRILPNLECQW